MCSFSFIKIGRLSFPAGRPIFLYCLCGYSLRQGRLGLAIELPVKCSCLEAFDFITTDVEFPEDVHRLD